MRLAGAKILLTGASSGIGAALAPQLADKGAQLALVARRRDRLDEVAALCPGGTARVWDADLADAPAAGALAVAIDAALGGVDILIANAATPCRVPADRLTAKRVDAVMDVNFRAPMHMALALLPRLLARRRGQLVFVSSMGGRIPIPHEAAYNASKFALCGFAEALALDLDGSGVEVKLILPGPIDTEIWTRPDNEPGIFDIEKVAAADCAAGIVAAMEGDGFESYVPPIFPGGVDARQIAIDKTTDCDRYIRGMAEVVRAVTAAAENGG
jgi:short-subunit dehydrogenase